MDFKIPVISVIGNKDSGKTSVMEALIKAFSKNGFKVATAKHVSQKNFLIDRKKTDTSRLYSAGSKLVMGISKSELFLLDRIENNEFSLDFLYEYVKDADLLLLEGFSKHISKEPAIGKIVCIKKREEIEKFEKKLLGEILAYCSLNPIDDRRVYSISEDGRRLFELTKKFVQNNH
jgi:molybdopterin-guanine dinucleotide biosynthesis protein MobB